MTLLFRLLSIVAVATATTYRTSARTMTRTRTRVLGENVDVLFVLILNDDNEDDDENARKRIHLGRDVSIARFISIRNPVIALPYVLLDFVLLYLITWLLWDHGYLYSSYAPLPYTDSTPVESSLTGLKESPSNGSCDSVSWFCTCCIIVVSSSNILLFLIALYLIWASSLSPQNQSLIIFIITCTSYIRCHLP